MYGKQAPEQFEVTRVVAPRALGLRVDGTKGTSGKGEYLLPGDADSEQAGGGSVSQRLQEGSDGDEELSGEPPGGSGSLINRE
jgi:hypothetical protein